MRGKNLLAAFILIASAIPTYAYEASLTSSSTTVDTNEKFTITVEIIEDETDTSAIEGLLIEGIENFNIISRAQSQTSNSSIREVNGNVETVRRAVNSIILTLSPKETGEFTIGPVELVGGDAQQYTNSIGIIVNEKKANSSIEEIQEIIDNYTPPIPTEELPNKYVIYILIFGLLIVLLIASILYYKKGEEITEEILKQSKIEEESEGIKKEDFEEIDKIEYPDTEDEEFAKKMENILRIKIAKKFNIKKKTLEEAINILEEKGTDTGNLDEITQKLYELKYSNILVSKAELLDTVKKF